MFRFFPLCRKVVSSPVWGLWKLYSGLWWAFSEDPAPATGPGQGAAFEVMDSRSPAKEAHAAATPAGTLRAGFIATLVVSVLVAIGAHEGYSRGALHATTTWWLWGWATVLACMTSLWAVRHVSRHQARLKAASWRDHARATGAGLADMGRQVAGAAVTTRDAAAVAGQHAVNAYRTSRDSVRRVVKRA